MRLGLPGKLAVGVTVLASTLSLQAASRAAGSKSASFTVTMVNTGQGVQVTVPAKVWITGNQARVEIKHPLNGDGLIVVTNGSVYKLDPKSHQGERTPLPPDMKKSKDNFTRFLSTFGINSDVTKHAKKLRTETMGGYVCDVFEDSATKEAMTQKVLIWMPQKMDPQIPLKAQVTQKVSKQGAQLEQTVTMTISDLKLNQPISPSMFAVPKGYKIKAGK